MCRTIYENNITYKELHNMKVDISRVNPEIAKIALSNANGQRNAAYSQYILLVYRSTGQLAPRCNAKDLQTFYDTIEVTQH